MLFETTVGAMMIVSLAVTIGILIATLHAVRPVLFVQRAVVIQCLVIDAVITVFLIKHIYLASKHNEENDSHRYVPLSPLDSLCLCVSI